jgi:hypothetical protein
LYQGRVRDSLFKNHAYGQSIGVHIANIDYSKRKFMKEAAVYQAAMSRVNLSVSLGIDAGVQTLTEKVDMIKEILVDQSRNAQCMTHLYSHLKLDIC